MASEGDRHRDQGGSEPPDTSSKDAATQSRRYSNSPAGVGPARRLVQADSVSDVVDDIGRIATETLGLPHTGVWLYENSDATLRPRSYPSTDRLPEKPPVFEEGDSPVWNVLQSGESRVVEEPWNGNGNGESSTRSVVVAPLGDHGVLISVIDGVDADGTNGLGLLEAAAVQALDRIGRGESEHALDTLHEATREMVAAESKETVVAVGLDAAVNELGLTQTGVHFPDEDARALVPVDWTGSLEEELGEPPSLGPNTMAWSAFEDREVVRVEDFWSQDGVYNPDTPFRSEMIVPIGDHGVALFSSTEPGAFDAEDQRFAEVLCSNAAAAMDRIGRERELERQTARQERLTRDVEASVEELADTSADVSGSSQQISALAGEQASTMEEVSEEVSDMSTVVEEIAAQADRVESTSKRTRSLAEDGHESATDAAEVMADIETATAEATDEFDELTERISEIDAMVEMINSVADRTNILALNASIEAANAGEAGAGFAVVADEVKSLAEETQQRAGRIEAQVHGVQARRDETVEKLQAATDRVEQGLEQVERTREHFEDIVDAVEETARGIEEVAAATDDQAEQSEDISRLVDDARQQADDVSTEIQEIATANQQQARMVRAIRESLDRANGELVDGGREPGHQ